MKTDVLKRAEAVNLLRNSEMDQNKLLRIVEDCFGPNFLSDKTIMKGKARSILTILAYDLIEENLFLFADLYDGKEHFMTKSNEVTIDYHTRDVSKRIIIKPDEENSIDKIIFLLEHDLYFRLDRPLSYSFKCRIDNFNFCLQLFDELEKHHNVVNLKKLQTPINIMCIYQMMTEAADSVMNFGQSPNTEDFDFDEFADKFDKATLIFYNISKAYAIKLKNLFPNFTRTLYTIKKL